MRKIAIVLLATAYVLLGSAFAQQFSDWGLRYNVGPPVNSAFAEFQPFLSKDGLRLYFTLLECATCSGGVPQDIWVSHRETVDSAWQDPVRLPINSTSNEATAFESIDGHFLFFASQRPGGYGRNDLYISKRQDKKVDVGAKGWEPAVNLGPSINTNFGERAPFLYEDEITGKITLYFTSNRSGNDDIYTSELNVDGSWGPVLPVTEINSSAGELMGVLSRDGHDIYFVSNRLGSQIADNGVDISDDIWMSHRTSTADTWSVPEPVTMLNTSNWEGKPALSWDGESIYFNSVQTAEECLERGQCNLSSAWDIWTASRQKLTGH